MMFIVGLLIGIVLMSLPNLMWILNAREATYRYNELRDQHDRHDVNKD